MKNSTHAYFHFNSLTAAQKSDYSQAGYLTLGRVLNDAGLEEMRRQCMDAWSADKGAFDGSKSWLQNSLLTDIHHRAAIVRDYYYRGPLVDVAEQLIGPNIKGATSQLTFKLRGNTMAFGWHQDNSYGELDPYNSLTTLTALDDTDESNGCLWIVPRSHQQGQVEPGLTLAHKKAEISVALSGDESQAIPVPMRAGEAIVFHCWMLHKSEGNSSLDRDRRILFMRYADADAVEVYNNRQPRLGKLLRGHTKFPEVAAFEQSLQ
ncbi:MAG: phytanoyl-CoA dioxygenase family protein [Planctomycetota bacterium]|nr:phytanoyl-CoA dioxygenase family protein [Planctomycetota bacterium]